jgi:hypothetical protein
LYSTLFIVDVLDYCTKNTLLVIDNFHSIIHSKNSKP